jgi:UDPglucose 6-dehydrogenase
MAAWGHGVVGTDSDTQKIERLEAGEMPFFEPGLEDLVKEGISSGRLRFSSDPEEAIGGAAAVFICVGTPPRATGEANLAAVESSSRTALRHATGPIVIVEKSTVPAGTAQRIKRSALMERPDMADDVDIVSNPEFLREGKAVQDSLEPDRILVGAESERAFRVMREVYAPLIEKGIPVFETNIPTAELAKHASNAFLSLKISFANALARMSERAGADVVDVVSVMGADERIGRHFLNAGLGYGGSCFSKDLMAFGRLASHLGYDFPLLEEIARVNDEAVDAAVDKVKDAVWNIEGKRIALLGLAFKPDTDDVRFAPALSLARQLLDEGADVVGYDPQAASNAKAEVPDLEIANDPYEAIEGAHCLVLATEWDEFLSLDLERVRDALAYPVVIDGRNFFDRDKMVSLGFTYYPTGRPSAP